MAPCDASPATHKRFLYLAIPVLLIGVLADQASKSWGVQSRSCWSGFGAEPASADGLCEWPLT
jgi:hypothetical protein